MALVVRMPEVLAGATEGALASWLVGVGDTVAVGQPLAEVETEKATVEYEAEAAGTIAGLLVETGVQVSVGTPIAVLAADGESTEQALAAAGPELGGAAPSPEPAAAEPVAAAKMPVAAAPVAATPAATAASPAQDAAAADIPQHAGRTFMSPLVRRLAAERGLDLSTVAGSGPGGRIVRRDIESLSAAKPTATPAAPATPAAAPAAASASVGATGSSYTDVPHTG
ncbi:MAG: biotin/lipoyl-containing protein, partial [Lacisediminihabitans sp.]